MAKFCGTIGFASTVETSPGIWEPIVTPKKYTGDLLRNQRRWERSEHPNEDLNISNEVSILADEFLQSNIGAVKWVEVYGAKWMVNSVTIDYPRITLTLGGVYNGG